MNWADAALAGLNRRETITNPPLPDDAQWSNFEAARKIMIRNFNQDAPPRTTATWPRNQPRASDAED